MDDYQSLVKAHIFSSRPFTALNNDGLFTEVAVNESPLEVKVVSNEQEHKQEKKPLSATILALKYAMHNEQHDLQLLEMYQKNPTKEFECKLIQEKIAKKIGIMEDIFKIFAEYQLQYQRFLAENAPDILPLMAHNHELYQLQKLLPVNQKQLTDDIDALFTHALKARKVLKAPNPCPEENKCLAPAVKIKVDTYTSLTKQVMEQTNTAFKQVISHKMQVFISEFKGAQSGLKSKIYDEKLDIAQMLLAKTQVADMLCKRVIVDINDKTQDQDKELVKLTKNFLQTIQEVYEVVVDIKLKRFEEELQSLSKKAPKDSNVFFFKSSKEVDISEIILAHADLKYVKKDIETLRASISNESGQKLSKLLSKFNTLEEHFQKVIDEAGKTREIGNDRVYFRIGNNDL